MSMLDESWVVLHRPSGTWWRANRSGYTSELMAAGVYTREEAEECARMRSPILHEDGEREYEERAMSLRSALKGLGDGTVGAMLLSAAGER